MNDENQGDLTEAESTELAGLKGEMADPRGVTFDGPWDAHYSHSTKKQDRARELLAREAGEPVEPEDQPAAMTEAGVADSLDVIGSMGEVGEEWAREMKGGNLGALEVAEDVRVGILGDMGVTAEDVAVAFDTLGDNVRASVFREFSNPYTPALPAADPADLEDFAESSAGQILVKEWGDDAGRKLATALYRWERTVEGLSDQEFAELDDFYRLRLRPQERAAVLRRLAA